jgi:hypothetical protein
MPPATTTRVAATPPRYPRRSQLPACPAPHRPWPAAGTGAPRTAHRAPRTACRPPPLRYRATWPAARAPRSRSGRPQARTGRTWRYRSAPARPRPLAGDRDGLAGRAAVVRRPGTVLAVTEAGQIIGFNPAGPLDRAIPDLAAQELATGQNRLRRLRIEKDAAGCTGLPG